MFHPIHSRPGPYRHSDWLLPDEALPVHCSWGHRLDQNLQARVHHRSPAELLRGVSFSLSWGSTIWTTSWLSPLWWDGFKDDFRELEFLSHIGKIQLSVMLLQSEMHWQLDIHGPERMNPDHWHDRSTFPLYDSIHNKLRRLPVSLSYSLD